MSDEEQTIEQPTEDNFGEGIFEEKVSVLQEEETDEGTIELTDREIAIAEGRDPDEVTASDKESDKGDADEESDEDPDGDDQQATDDEDGDDESNEQDAKEVGWTASDKRLAAKYGLTEEDLNEFGTTAALHRAIDVLDRKSDASDDGEGDGSVDEGSDAASADGAPDLLSELKDLETLDLSQYEDYEPEDKALAEHLSKTQEALNKMNKVIGKVAESINVYEQREIEQRQQAAATVLNNSLSEYPDLYGSVEPGKKVSKANQQARQEVAEQAEIIYQGYMAKGEEPKLEEVFEKAILAAHGKQLPKRQLNPKQAAKRKSQLKQQSNQRRSPGRKAGTQKRTNPDTEDPSAIANDKELVEMFDNFQVENGIA